MRTPLNYLLVQTQVELAAETTRVAEFFEALASDGVIRQGYLYARPEPAEDWLRRMGEAPNRFSPGGLA